MRTYWQRRIGLGNSDSWQMREVDRCTQIRRRTQVRRFAEVDGCAHVGKVAQARVFPTGARCEALTHAHRSTDAHRPKDPYAQVGRVAQVVAFATVARIEGLLMRAGWQIHTDAQTRKSEQIRTGKQSCIGLMIRRSAGAQMRNVLCFVKRRAYH